MYECPVTTDTRTHRYCPPLGSVLLETKGSYGSSLSTSCLQGSRPEVLSSPPAVLESLVGELAHPSPHAFFFFFTRLPAPRGAVFARPHLRGPSLIILPPFPFRYQGSQGHGPIEEEQWPLAGGQRGRTQPCQVHRWGGPDPAEEGGQWLWLRARRNTFVCVGVCAHVPGRGPLVPELVTAGSGREDPSPAIRVRPSPRRKEEEGAAERRNGQG